jgi:hypothetical protein
MTDNGFISIKPDKSLIRPTRYLWKNRISRGGLALLVGPEESGKGFLAVHLMARLTWGKLPGCYEGHPIRVEVVAYEDSKAEWNKRMDAAGADAEMWTMLEREDGSIFNLRSDLKDLITHWREEKVRFVYIDQLQDHLGVTTDSYNNKQVREALVPLHHNLDKAYITALAALHPNKRGDTAREKVNGSIGTLAVVRSAHYVANHPDDEQVKVMVPIKNSRGPKEPALEFEIEDTSRTYRVNGRYVKCGVIRELVPSLLGFDDLNKGGRKNELDRGVRSLLSDGEWHWYSDIHDEYPYNYNVLRRCAGRIGADIEQVGFPARARWRLPRAGGGA